jgi:hypothetical protein
MFSLFQAAVAALVRGVLVFFRAFFTQVASSAPQAPGRFFAVYPDVAKLLAVVIFRQGIMGFVCLHLDSDMTQGCQFQYICTLWLGLARHSS